MSPIIPFKRSKILQLIINIFHFVRSQITLNPCIYLLIASILFIQSLFFFSRYPSPAPTSLLPPFDTKCNAGRVYVYQLPSMFNADLVGTCEELHPWRWTCGLATNGGYGKTATELAGIVPDSLAPTWHRTTQYSAEVIFHTRILNYRCRTLEPESAAVFYIPFYAGLAAGEDLYYNRNTTKRDYPVDKLIEWLQSQPYWKRSNGSDHLVVLGRMTWDFRRLTSSEKLWGSKFLNMPEIQNVTRLLIERETHDYHDVAIPYPTGFHPRSIADIRTWQNFVRTYNRTSLFTFVGAARENIRDDIRSILLRTCRNESLSGTCRVVDCAMIRCTTDSSAAMEAFLRSDFCLQPKGDSPTRRSMFDCMVAGSIPVLFWNETVKNQYEWYLGDEPEKYSVFIDHDDVRDGNTSIKKVLQKYSKEEVRKIRENVIEMIPNIVYGESSSSYSDDGFRDAFEIAMEGVLQRLKVERDQRRRESTGHR